MNRRSFVTNRRSFAVTRTSGPRQAVRYLRGLGVGVLAAAVATCNPDRSSGPCAAGSLVFTAQPGSATAGVPLSPAVTVEARDGGGQRAACFTGDVTVTLAANPGGGTLSGTTTVAAVGGVATFANLILNRSAAGYSLTATAGSVTSGGSAVFTVNPAPASQLVVTGQPANATAGVSLSPAVQVTARDAFDNNAAFTGDVTLAITAGTGPPGAVLNGAVRVAAVGGVATFANINITKAGTGYTLTATATGLTGAATSAFTIAAAAAAELTFTVHPSSTPAGTAFMAIVTALDAFGNEATSFSNNVTVALGNNPPPGGTLTGTLNRAASGGSATFDDLRINRVANGYTLVAAATGLIGDASASFNIVPGAATQLVFTAQPATTEAGQPLAAPGGVTVTALDSEGNTATGFTGQVTMAITSGTGTAGAQLANPGPTAAVSGVATFTTLSIGRAGTGYTLTATAGALTSSPSAAFDITTAPAAALFFTTGPVNRTAGEGFVVTVTARDAFGNDATDFVAQITLAFGTNPAGGALSGTLQRTATAGVVEFTGLSIDKAGTGYTLTANAASLTGATSAAFDIVAAAATQLAFTTQPTTTVSNAAIAAVEVTARDQFGNTAGSFNAQVTLVIGANPGGGTLAGTAQQAAINGVATFPGLSIDQAGTGYTLAASAGALAGATSAAFNIVPAAASQLAFTAQPTTTTAGQAIATVTVTARDPAGNTVTAFTDNVNIAIGTNPTGGTLGGTLQQAAVAGVATFAGLNIRTAGAGYQLLATSGSLTTPLSSAFTITPDVAAAIVFSAQPGPTRAGQAIQGATGGVKVTAKDQFGNDATGFTSPVGVAITPGTGAPGATLSNGAPVSAVGGIATFANLQIDLVGGGYTLTATTSGLTAAISTAFDVSSAPATQLVFTTPPADAVAGANIPVTVTARDQFGNTATDFTSAVTVAIGNNAGPGGVLGGTTSVNAAAGVATFTTLSINRSGIGYTLTTSSTGLTGATSAAFDITAGAATKLVFTVEPVTTAAAPAAITPAVQVSAQDALDNTDLTFTANVTVAIGTNAGTPTPGVLAGTTTKAAAGGVVSFNDLTIDKVGTGYTLTASSAGLAGATSTGFDIFANTATHLAFTVEPTNAVAGVSIAPAVKVSALDASNNVVPGFSGGITVAITPVTGDPAAVLGGTKTVAAALGVATFSDLNIDNAADGYRLDATAGGVTGATSALFDITPAAATHLAFSVQPANAVAGVAIASVEVAALDAFDNVDTAYTTNIAVSIGTNPSGGTLSGTASVPAINGLATFSTLSINRSGAGYTLLATSGVLTDATSAAFTISHAPLNQLVFTGQPGNTVAGQTIGPAVTVTGQDQFGNTVTSFAGDVIMAIGNDAGPGGVLSGATTQTASSGVATFDDLSIDKAGSGYTLSATTAGLGGAFPSAGFDITAGAATTLAFTVQPGNTTAGTSIAAIVVAAQDGLGNTVPTFNGDITVAIGTNGGTPTPGTLSGTTTIAASSGLATFSNLSINKSGPGYTLSATSPGVPGAFTSAAFSITAGAATTLAFTVQPTTTTAGPPATIPAVQVSAQDGLGNTDPTFTGDVTVAIGTNGGTPTPGALSGTTTVPNATAGVATFSNLSIDKAGPGYTLAVSTTAAGVTGATSNAFTVNAGAATQLVITQQPSNVVAGAPISPAVTVEARDGQGNVDPTYATQVNLEFVNNAGSPVPGTLADFTAMPSTGIATFPSLSVDKVGTGYTIRATSAGVAPSATSTAFNVTPGPAASLAFTVNPSNATTNATITPAVKVTALDLNANVATGFNGNIVVAIGLNPGLGTLSGTVTQAAVAGVASFSTLSINNAGMGYTLTASASGLADATSGTFDILTSTATQLFFSVQPSTAEAGAGMAGIVVQARDASGQLATSFDGVGSDVTLAIAGGTGAPGAIIGGVTTVSAVGGVATFTGITIDKAASNYRLQATATGLAAATSGFFSITPAAVHHLVFQVQPSNATALAAITPQVEVAVKDQFDNTITGFTGDITVAIGTNPGTGVLSGTATVGAASGVATFADLSIDEPGIGYDLDASIATPGVPVLSSTPFDITASASSRLVFTTQPSTATAGQSISPAVVLEAQDAVGNTLTGFTGDVTLAITAGTGTNGATLSGTVTVAAISGVATFSDLNIDKRGSSYRLSATAPGLAGTTSGTFNINAGAATRLDFDVDPVTTAAGQTITPAVVVQARDDFGNPDDTFSGDVTLVISTNPGDGTLTGTTTVTASGGLATFSDLSIDKSGIGYRLTASSGMLATDVSKAFSITGGAADHLTFTVAPSDRTAGLTITPAVRVTAFDALGNVATGFTDDVTIAITMGTGAPGALLAGTLTQAPIDGVATFGDLSIEKAGTGYTLSATSTVTGTTSASFTILPAAATKLGYIVQPSTTAANASITPAVRVAAQDQFGNTVTTFAGSVTIVIGTNAGGPGTVLTGGGSTALVSGVATFSNLSINNPGTGFTLSASSSPVLTGVISSPFNITP